MQIELPLFGKVTFDIDDQRLKKSFLERLPKLTGNLGKDSAVIVERFINYKVLGDENIPKKGPFIVVGNHLLVTKGIAPLPLDAMLISFIVEKRLKQPVYWFAKANLKTKIPFLNTNIYHPLFTPLRQLFIRRYRMIPVNSTYSPGRRRKVLREARKLLNKGAIIGILPEGEAHQSLVKGKKGAALLAISFNKNRNCEQKVPIVPVGVSEIEKGISFSKRIPGTLNFGEAIVFSGNEEPGWATDKLMKSIAALLPKKYQGVYKSEL